MHRHIRGRAALLIVIAAASGCGSSSPGLDRHIVSGTVTLDGKPLESGMIQFSPAPGATHAIFSGTTISQGKYRLPSEGGLPPGNYVVSISSSPPPPPPPKDPAEAMKAAETFKPAPERIPSKYNLKTELAADVKDQGETTADFDLKSGS